MYLILYNTILMYLMSQRNGAAATILSTAIYEEKSQIRYKLTVQIYIGPVSNAKIIRF